MTLLIAVCAAVVSTIIWYTSEKARACKIGTLVLMYWGASLMWLVDAVVEYFELGAEYFTPSASDMLNDSFLGFSVVVLGLVIWCAVLIIKDPKNTVSDILKNGKK